MTRYRRDVFTQVILGDLRGILIKICADFKFHLVEFGGRDNHVHLLVTYPPKIAVSPLMDVERQRTPH